MDNNQKRPLLEDLIFPVNLIKVGSIFMLLYAGAAAFVCVQVTDFIRFHLVHFIQAMREEHNLQTNVVVNLYLFGQILSWFLVYPLLLTSQVLPIRLIFLHDKLPIIETLKNSFPALRLAVQALYYACRRAPIYFIPFIALLLLEAILQDHLNKPSYLAAYYIVLAAVAFGVCLKILPYLLMPFTAVIGKLEAPHAEYKTILILNYHSKALASIVVIGLSLAAAIHLFAARDPLLYAYEYIAHLVLHYYVALVLGGFIVRELARIEVAQYNANRRP